MQQTSSLLLRGVLFSNQVIGNSFAYTLPVLTDAGARDPSGAWDARRGGRSQRGCDSCLGAATTTLWFGEGRGSDRRMGVPWSCAAFCAVKFYAFEALEEFALIAAIIALH